MMDSILWDNATRDYDAERKQATLEKARLAVVHLWPFLSKASSRLEFADRVELSKDKIEAAVRAVAGSESEYVGLFPLVMSSLEEDFATLSRSRRLAAEDTEESGEDGAEGDSEEESEGESEDDESDDDMPEEMKDDKKESRRKVAVAWKQPSKSRVGADSVYYAEGDGRVFVIEEDDRSGKANWFVLPAESYSELDDLGWPEPSHEGSAATVDEAKAEIERSFMRSESSRRRAQRKTAYSGQSDAAFFQYDANGGTHTLETVELRKPDGEYVYALVTVSGMMRVLHGNNTYRTASDLIDAGFDTDEKLAAAEASGEIEWLNNPWFEVFVDDSGAEGAIENTYDSAVEEAHRLLQLHSTSSRRRRVRARRKTAGLNKAESTYDWFVCDCGNEADYEGFSTVLPDGTEIEPLIGSAWEGHYQCDRCGYIITREEAHSLPGAPTTANRRRVSTQRKAARSLMWESTGDRFNHIEFAIWRMQDQTWQINLDRWSDSVDWYVWRAGPREEYEYISDVDPDAVLVDKGHAATAEEAKSAAEAAVFAKTGRKRASRKRAVTVQDVYYPTGDNHSEADAIAIFVTDKGNYSLFAPEGYGDDYDPYEDGGPRNPYMSGPYYYRVVGPDGQTVGTVQAYGDEMNAPFDEAVYNTEQLLSRMGRRVTSVRKRSSRRTAAFVPHEDGPGNLDNSRADAYWHYAEDAKTEWYYIYANLAHHLSEYHGRPYGLPVLDINDPKALDMLSALEDAHDAAHQKDDPDYRMYASRRRALKRRAAWSWPPAADSNYDYSEYRRGQADGWDDGYASGMKQRGAADRRYDWDLEPTNDYQQGYQEGWSEGFRSGNDERTGYGSPVAPDWFDPANAGERWSDDW